MKGRFITFEGPDGAGKTTQMRMLGKRLEAMGREIVYTREPGGTRISEEIRRILLDPTYKEMVDRTEALLYAAARAQHVEELIRPALVSGKIVLCDRFTDSTVAYQGYGRGIDISFLHELNTMAVAGETPDLTIILDLDPAEGLNRISQKRAVALGKGKDRIEQEDIDFHQKVRTGFHRLAAADPGRCKMISASTDRDALSETIWRLVKEVLENENS